MSFFESSQDVSLSRSVLHAQCRGNDGQFHASSIDLNKLIGNNSGSFQHPGDSWFDTATNSFLDGRILHAQLENNNGGSNDAEIDLDTFIKNINGRLTT